MHPVDDTTSQRPEPRLTQRLRALAGDRKLVRGLLRAAGIIGISAILVLSLLPGDLQAPIRTAIGPALEHLAAYSLVGLALRGGFAGRGATWAIVAGLAALAGLMELAQTIVPGRVGSLEDVAVSAAGGLVGALLGSRIDRRLARR